MSEDDFGFAKAKSSTADKLKTIRPQNSPAASPPLARVDAAGDALGFRSRERGGQGVYRRKREIGPTVAINMRAPERVAIPFIRFCEENRFSYWEGIEELMNQVKLLRESP
jgi:hypothetical protein